MSKGLQWIALICFMLSTSLFDGNNIGLTKEIDNLRESVICVIEKRGTNEEQVLVEDNITIGYAGAFWVEEDETVYLLASYDGLVLECKRGEIREIPLAQTVLPVNLVSDANRLYIYDEALSELQIYSKQGELLARSKIILQDDYVKGLRKTDGEIALLTYGNQKIVIHPETGEQELLTEEPVVIDAGTYDFAEYIAADEEGTTYAVYTSLVKDCSVISGELTLRAVSETGELLGSYILPVQEYTYLPMRYVQVWENGNIYLLVPTEETVEVRKVALKESMESQMDAISQEATEIEEKYAMNTRYRISIGSAYTGGVSYTRAGILERALEMANYQWVLTDRNIRLDYADPGVILPKEIEHMAKEREEQSSWSVTMTGIPYCWGGFYAVDGGVGGRSFQNLLDRGYVTGNINSDGNYKYFTAGLDCSGFVSAAFGFNNKLSTKGLSDVGSKKTDIKALEQMDFLVYPSEHVILFGEWIDDATILVIEAAIKDGKVVVHPKSLNELVIDGMYQMRSPW